MPSDAGRLPRFGEWYRGSNKRLFEILSIYLNVSPDYVTAEMMEEMTRGTEGGASFALASLAAAACGLDVWENPRDKAFFRDYFLPSFSEISPEPFLNDPYMKRIVFPERVSGKWSFEKKKCRPFECFVRDDPTVSYLPDGTPKVIPNIGFFREEYAYPAVCENGREWMTLMPNEIATSAPAVRAARGKVLTYGLGLGYFAFAASEKPEVESVVAVERSADAAELFERNILPQFPHADKVRVEVGDAFAFAGKGMRGYDFVFCDIWHDPSDGKELYLRMKEYEKSNPGPEYVYWLEKTILLYLQGE